MAIVLSFSILEKKNLIILKLLPYFVNIGETLNKKVSAMNFYAYRIMIRQNETNYILHYRQLYHQFLVDMYAKIETERLLYIRLNQKSLRSEEYIHLRDAISNDGNVNDIGKMVILPATFTGSPRHMHEYAQDAMAYVRSYGRPDFFITFTCNPTWNEIKELLLPGQVPSDRHDLTARIFKQKLTKLMDLIVKHHIYGETRCWMYSIEWQKRGLPHAHILIWLKEKIHLDQIDDVISAEIPNQVDDPLLFDIVTKNMVHGPCGALNLQSPCMADGKCTKRYPKDLIHETCTGNDSYPQYRRRKPEEGGQTAKIRVKNNEIEIDNRWIVPYSPLLSKTFQAHINVEYCNSVKSIKYICKYVNKGSDMAVFGVNEQNTDEVTQYQMGRYISSNEAAWRILSFPIHNRHPTVVHLSVHLENGQRVYFTTANARNIAADPPHTTLTAFFALCSEDRFATTLLYEEVPKYYTWNAALKKFQRRKQGMRIEGHENVYATDALGRVYTVHPNNAECYYLRMLLVNVKGPTSFTNLRTVNGDVCQTYREACQQLHLLENDQHWEITLTEASVSCHPRQIRTLFAIILTTCSPSNPKDLWEKFKEDLSEDILHHVRITNHDNAIQFSENIFNEALIKIEDLCLTINNKTLIQLGMVAPERVAFDISDRDLLREQEYNVENLQIFVTENTQLLTAEQQSAYNTITNAVTNGNVGLFFLDAPGGTGKTFLINLLLAHIRSQKGIALAIASSGIAATLLDGGRTAHSALKLPLNMQFVDSPTCNISKGSGIAKVLKVCKIIIWDECTMAHKKSLEALDRTTQDLRENTQPFGGALILLAGDFRQTLPVIPKSTSADELNACIKASHLWRHVQKITLKTNMRVHLQHDASADTFSKQLLDIGNGKVPIDAETKCITFPSNFCVIVPSIEQLIQKVYPEIRTNYKNHDWLFERAILAATNNDVNAINKTIQDQIVGESVTYKSIDSVMNADEVVNYPIEFLNSLELPGIPPHILTLKVGAAIILLRNINPPKLCNGTRLAVKKLLPNVIEATILNGKSKGEDVLIPRIPMIPTDMPFDFKRLQFPIRLAFSMTINKAQGQSLKVCGLNLENPCFSHGQLYVACSRVGQPKNLFIFAQDARTKNIVYPKALE